MKAAAKNLLALLFWGIVWHILALSVHNPLLLPTPLSVLKRLWELVCTTAFWQITLASLTRILYGTLIAVFLGIVLAVLTTTFSPLDQLISPLLTAIQASPVASFSVLLLVWVDRDLVPGLICGLMVLPVIWSNVSTGIRGTDTQLLEIGKVYRLPWWRVLGRIYVPSVMPHFRTGCRNGLSLGWKAGVAAEVLTVPLLSIGRQIHDAKLYLETLDLFAWTLAVILLSLLLQKLMLILLEGRRENA